MRGALQYWNDKLGRGEPHVTKLLYKITGAGTFTALEGNASLVSEGAITDAAIAAFLGETDSPFAAAAFDATAMGNDIIGGVVDFSGQVKELIGMKAVCLGVTTAVTVGCAASADMTASTLQTECAMKNGNVAWKANFGNSPDFDGLTAGLIEVTLYWRSK